MNDIHWGEPKQARPILPYEKIGIHVQCHVTMYVCLYVRCPHAHHVNAYACSHITQVYQDHQRKLRVNCSLATIAWTVREKLGQ